MFLRKRPAKASNAGLSSVPKGAQMISVEKKREYENVPLHIYHPNPYNAITILRNKRNQHELLVCGWYLDTYREGGVVKGLVYREVSSEEDRAAVISELKKTDKESSIKFSP